MQDIQGEVRLNPSRSRSPGMKAVDRAGKRTRETEVPWDVREAKAICRQLLDGRIGAGLCGIAGREAQSRC